MHQLGITPSHSRPRVSNDNPHAEAFFRSAKYHPTLRPNGFATLEEARKWAHELIDWYNHEHRHSALRFVTPTTKHTGEDILLLAERKALYQSKRTEKPNRWIRNRTRNWEPILKSTLNPVESRKIEKPLKKTA